MEEDDISEFLAAMSIGENGKISHDDLINFLLPSEPLKE